MHLFTGLDVFPEVINSKTIKVYKKKSIIYSELVRKKSSAKKIKKAIINTYIYIYIIIAYDEKKKNLFNS